MTPDLEIAVLIPCYNEALTIASVVSRFQACLPNAQIYVYDNNSSDETSIVARRAGATVRTEPRQGKGHVVRRMFADVDADVFVLIDGDDTYDVAAAPRLVQKLIEDNLDFVNGARRANPNTAYRPGHRFGNALFTALVRIVFGRQFNDILSEYKAFSRRFVKSFPAMSGGFETETELAVHALELRMPSAEIETDYRDRPDGSLSKLNTFRDGLKILILIAALVKDERPFQFFGIISVIFAASSVLLSIPLFKTFSETGLVPRLPTAVLCVGLMLVGILFFLVGLILDMTTQTRREMKRLIYLSTPYRSVTPADGSWHAR